MNTFEQIMSPFIFIIKQILLFSYEITGNYGWSIILLSFAISLLLLPVFIYIEKSKKKDDVVKKKMQPLIDEIKRVYKGQERFYYIKTINRQHNYSSFKALIPILSLLLQIPFFIAAYQFLEHFEPLKEVGFWFIKDLSQPDALFGVVNFLPVLMTIVNLVTVYFYTINGDGSERKQMLILAVAFLILLFDLPAGLVLYWTMNNVFSFFRLFITNPEVFKNKKIFRFPNIKADFIKIIPVLKKGFVVIFLLALSSQFYWAIKYNFDDIFTRIGGAFVVSAILSLIAGLAWLIFIRNRVLFTKIKIQPSLFFSLLFLSVYFYFASKFYFSGENTSLGILAILFLIPTQFIGYLYTLRASKKIKRLIYQGTSIVLFVLFAYQLILVSTYFSGNEISLDFAKFIINIGVASLTDILSLGIVFSLITMIYYYRFQEIDFVQSNKSQGVIFLLSVLYIFGLIFFWNPLIVYSSFPEDFDFPAFQFLSHNFLAFAISILASILLYFSVPKKIKSLIPQVFLSIVVVVFLYSSIIPFDVGTLQINFFSKENNLAAETYYYLLEAGLLVVIFISISKIFKSKFFKQISYVLIVLNLFIIAQSLYLSINTGMFFTNKNSEDHQHAYTQIKEIPFSKDEENIVFFIIDAAQGWFMKDIFNEDPKLKELYDGFVWYPNTISTSNYTYASVPAMMCGEDFTIANMNKDETTSITQKVTNSTIQFYDNIKAKGYYFTGHHLKYALTKPTQIDNYLPKWNKNWSALLNVTLQKSIWFSQLWQNALFSSSPLFLKPRIYNHNKWFERKSSNAENKEINTTELLSKYSFIKILPEISKSESKESNFIFIHSMFAHAPWDLITEDNKLISDVSPYENQKLFIQLFTDWLQWMKENEVYDNTKIILASDHGRSWWHYQQEINTRNIPIIWTKDKTINIEQFLRLNPLMLIKDFKAKGKLKEDWRLMSNLDTYAIAFNDQDPTKIDRADRTVNTYYTEWHTDLHTRKRYYNNLAFRIKNNVYDLHNWEQLNATNKSVSSIISSSDKSIYLTPKYDSDLINKRRTKIISRITNSEKWLRGVNKQSEERNISLDSMLVISANYVIRQQDNEAKEKRTIIIDSIRKDAVVMEQINLQANAMGITTDSMMVIVATNILLDIKK